MAKKGQNSDLLALAMSATKNNITKARGGSGKTTYLDRFINSLLDKDGKPTEPKTRTQIIAEISLDICIEERLAAIENGEDLEEFTLTAEGDSQDDQIFKDTNKRVKNQVAAAVANNKNSTSVSYNPKYKDVWHVVKNGPYVSLAEGPAPESDETDGDGAE